LAEKVAYSKVFWDNVWASSTKPPSTIVEFAARFSSDDACRAALFHMRYPHGFVCPKCGDTRGYVLQSRNVVECGEGHQTSLTAGTVMHHTLQPVITWFWAAWLMVTFSPGISAVQFQRQLGIRRYDTAHRMLHRLRAGLAGTGHDKLHGDVEVDEMYIGGPEAGHPGRGAVTKALVAVAVEVRQYVDKAGRPRVRAGRARMLVIPNGKAVTLIKFIQANVDSTSTVYTDANRSYGRLALVGYKHDAIVAKHTDDPLPTLGRVTANLQRWWLGTHKGAIKKENLQSYLDEFVFRFNRRRTPWEAFFAALGLAMVARPQAPRKRKAR
jgi:transposase-like protein